MKIFYRHQLDQFQETQKLFGYIERGFVNYSEGKVSVPPVGHLYFKPSGDLHIKSASVDYGDYYAVKVAGFFPNNRHQGLASIQGMITLFSQKTGEPVAIFLDEGYLTHLRTAIAGAICAKYLAPKHIEAIGILGAGAQAHYQLKLLSHVTSCREVWVWAPRKEQLELFCRNPELNEFSIQIANSPKELAERCQLIVTTTPSTKPLLFASDIKPGTHLTAVGSDDPGKQELDPAILQKANHVIVDSRSQCFAYGETYCAIQAGLLQKEAVVELGEVIAGSQPGRLNDNEITVADLTGIGVQDLEIATAFFETLSDAKPPL